MQFIPQPKAYLSIDSHDPDGITARDLLIDAGFHVVVARIQGFGFPEVGINHTLYIGLGEIKAFIATISSKQLQPQMQSGG